MSPFFIYVVCIDCLVSFSSARSVVLQVLLCLLSRLPILAEMEGAGRRERGGQGSSSGASGKCGPTLPFPCLLLKKNISCDNLLEKD